MIECLRRQFEQLCRVHLFLLRRISLWWQFPYPPVHFLYVADLANTSPLSVCCPRVTLTQLSDRADAFAIAELADDFSALPAKVGGMVHPVECEAEIYGAEAWKCGCPLQSGIDCRRW